MRVAILSDVHAAIEALDAVLTKADAEADRIVFLGDLVGYYADPNACVERIRARNVLSIAGNHDRAAAGLLDTSEFGEAGRRAMVWTRRVITRDNADYLASLSTTAMIPGDVLLLHGALHPEPNVEIHVSTIHRARRSLIALRDGPYGARVAFFGHTHKPVIHRLTANGGVESFPAERMRLTGDSHWLVNPGSVGQSRDGDPRASFAIFDTESREVQFERVDYDIDAVRSKAARAGLLYESPPLEQAIRRITDWIETGKSAVKRRLA